MADLSDEEHDIDIESDEDDGGSTTGGLNFLTEFVLDKIIDDPKLDAPYFFKVADKKAHHNALERKRRDHIKESFTRLRDSIPETKKEKTSRALILKRATDYIKQMSQRNQTRQKEIEKMKRQNQILRQQVQAAERAQANGSFILSDSFLSPGSNNNSNNDFDLSESSEEGSEENADTPVNNNSNSSSNNINISSNIRTSKRAKIRN